MDLVAERGLCLSESGQQESRGIMSTEPHLRKLAVDQPSLSANTCSTLLCVVHKFISVGV